MDDLDSLCLVEECRDLGECFDTHYRDAILVDADEVGMQEVKRVIKIWTGRIVCGDVMERRL